MVSACVKALGLEAIKSGCLWTVIRKRQNVKELLALLMKRTNT